METNCRSVWENNLTKFKREVGVDLSVCVLNILPKACSLQVYWLKTLREWRYRFFKRSFNLTLVTWSKDHVLGTSHIKLVPCLVWYTYIVCREIYVFYLSLDLTRTLHWGTMHIYGWGNSRSMSPPWSKTWIVLPLKNWVNCIITQPEKMSQS